MHGIVSLSLPNCVKISLAQIGHRACEVTARVSKIFRPSAIGVASGVIDFSVSVLIIYSSSLVGLKILETEEDDDPSPLTDNAIVPIIEEFIFRYAMQGTIKWLAFKFLPDKDIQLSSHYQIKLATLVSIVVTGLLFGASHYSNGNGIVPVIVCSVSGIFYGFLREEHGMVTPTVAHMTANTLVDLTDRFFG